MQAQVELARPSVEATPKVWLNRAGLAMGFAGIIFVGYELSTHWHGLADLSISVYGFSAIALLCCLYAAANALLAIGWKHLLADFDQKLSTRWALTAYAVSGLAKYVPGNIFQFVSRHGLGLAAGLNNRQLIRSTLLEFTCLILAGAACAIVLLPSVFPSLGIETAVGLSLAATCCLCAIAFQLGGLHMALAAALYWSFVCLSGLIFTAVFQVITSANLELSTMLHIAAAFVLAWLLGLLVPGAPAGIGVREAALLGLLGAIAPSSVIAIAVLLGRLVTVAGDLLFFAFGQVLAGLNRANHE